MGISIALLQAKRVLLLDALTDPGEKGAVLCCDGTTAQDGLDERTEPLLLILPCLAVSAGVSFLMDRGARAEQPNIGTPFLFIGSIPSHVPYPYIHITCLVIFCYI
jgi:hypothetical protein